LTAPGISSPERDNLQKALDRKNTASVLVLNWVSGFQLWFRLLSKKPHRISAAFLAGAGYLLQWNTAEKNEHLSLDGDKSNHTQTKASLMGAT
jgi:hypothetical protein